MSKRKNGSGAIYHRADGRWEAQFKNRWRRAQKRLREDPP
jgi:hypothetical protein